MALPVRVLEVLPDEREHRVDAAIADHLGLYIYIYIYVCIYIYIYRERD